ncbi:MAG: hypothetical protein WCK14_00835 [Actinomycetota bacterium]|jgi:hypothetical protein
MSWLPSPLPQRSEVDGITFVPLTPKLLSEDYAAVMRDLEMLRIWSGENWPTEQFTEANNLVDLVHHDREQREGVALTYSVLRNDVVIGCIYVRPIADALLTRSVLVDLSDLPAADIVVRGWSHDISAAELIASARAFLLGDPFTFPRLWWQTNIDCVEQLDACDGLGLSRRLSFFGESTMWVLAAKP